MATFSYTNTFTAGAPAVATQVNANFNDVKAFAVAIAAGTNIDTNAVTGTKIAANAVSYAKLDSSITNLLTPIAGVVQYMGATEPTNWKFCNGQVLTIATYPDLYAALTNGGTVFRYGANPTGSTFVLPDMRHRVPVGLGTEAEFDTLGEVGGSKVGIQSHDHTYSGTVADGGTHAHTTNAGGGTHSHSITLWETSSTGHVHAAGSYPSAGPNMHNADTPYAISGGAHDHTISTAPNHNHTYSGTVVSTGTASGNLQPYMVVNYLIRVL